MARTERSEAAVDSWASNREFRTVASFCRTVRFRKGRRHGFDGRHLHTHVHRGKVLARAGISAGDGHHLPVEAGETHRSQEAAAEAPMRRIERDPTGSWQINLRRSVRRPLIPFRLGWIMEVAGDRLCAEPEVASCLDEKGRYVATGSVGSVRRGRRRRGGRQTPPVRRVQAHRSSPDGYPKSVRKLAERETSRTR